MIVVHMSLLFIIGTVVCFIFKCMVVVVAFFDESLRCILNKKRRNEFPLFGSFISSFFFLRDMFLFFQLHHINADTAHDDLHECHSIENTIDIQPSWKNDQQCPKDEDFTID